MAKPRIVMLGNSNVIQGFLQSLASTCDVSMLSFGEYEFGEEFSGDAPALIICETPPDGISNLELAQSLRMNYPTTPIYLLVQKRTDFDRAALQKNGFSDAFLLPADKQTMEVAIKREMALASKGALRVYRSVEVVDIEPGLKLGFDLYLHLPANNRYVKYVSARDVLDSEKASKLQTHQISSASVSEEQVKEFYSFSAKRLKALGKNDSISETEKQERREKAVRALISGIFSDSDGSNTLEGGRDIMQDCTEIVKSYIIGDAPNSWYERFIKVSSSTTGTYNHAANVSSLACLLAIGIGITDVEELGLAGLLHDIGTADLPPEICEKPATARTAEETAIYQKHPQKSVDMIKNKKMIVSEKVMKAILQHHERYDGTGYPSQVAGDRICIEAQLLRVADEIEKLIAVAPEQARVNPLSAIKKVLELGNVGLGSSMISPELARKILQLLPT